MIQVNELSVRFSGGAIRALEPGDKTVIIGETGSGKSVLIQAILRLLPTGADIRGEVLYNGEDLQKAARPRLDELRGGELAYIPQGGGGSLNPLLNVGFQVGEPLMEHRGYSKKRAQAAAVPLLERFHLGRERELAQAYPHMFSGGMRQRAMIAMGVSAGAPWIFADEPTKGLDRARINEVTENFLQLTGETLLCVTHDLAFARAVGKRAMVLYAAELVEDGPAEELFDRPLHPYTRAMLDAQPDRGMKCCIGFAPLHTDYRQSGCRFAPRCPECTGRCAETPPLAALGNRKVRCWKYAAGGV